MTKTTSQKLTIIAIVAATITIGGILAFMPLQEAEAASIEGELIGIPGTPPTLTLRTIGPAGAPWSVADSEVELESNGDLEVEIEGLIVVPLGLNPFPSVDAVLTCEGVGIVGLPISGSLSPAGDGELKGNIGSSLAALSPCVGPIIIVTNPGSSAWFAATGF